MFLPNAYSNLGGSNFNPMQFQQPMPQQVIPQQIQQPVTPPFQPTNPVQPNYQNIGNNGRNMNYDFQGKQVTSYEEVRNHPVPIDGRPTIFVDDINNKLYFKYISANGDITIQPFTISSDLPVQTVTESDTNHVKSSDFITKGDFDLFKKELLEEIKGGK